MVLPAGIITECLNSILTQYATETCPPPSKRKWKTKFRWSTTFKPLAENIINAYHAYQQVKHLADEGSEKLATLRTAKKLPKKAQWHTAARQHEDITIAIMNSCYKNSKDEFHKLIKHQRKACKRSVTVDFGDHTRDTETNSWGSYFKQLATPQQDYTFDSNYEKYLPSDCIFFVYSFLLDLDVFG